MFIGRKLMVSVGEVVNGGPLPPVPRHTPVCSFNSQNKYVGESLATELPISAQRSAGDSAGESSCHTCSLLETSLSPEDSLGQMLEYVCLCLDLEA